MPTTTEPTTRTNRALELAGRLVVAPALLIAPFVAIDRAAAACNPPSPINNPPVTVTCTGTTTNQNGTNGYGTNTDTGNTINVQSGASVTGDTSGLLFNNGTVNNLGTITATGANGSGIGAAGTADVTNSGKITAGAGGVGIGATVA